MKIEGYFLGMAFFVVIVIVGIIAIQDMNTSYGINDFDNSSLGKIMQNSTDLLKYQNQMANNLEGEATSGTSGFDTMIYGGYLALRSMMQSIGKAGNVLAIAIMTLWFVNPIIATLLLSSLGIMLILMVVLIIMRVYRS